VTTFDTVRIAAVQATPVVLDADAQRHRWAAV
jgi:hypothetical protein